MVGCVNLRHGAIAYLCRLECADYVTMVEGAIFNGFPTRTEGELVFARAVREGQVHVFEHVNLPPPPPPM